MYNNSRWRETNLTTQMGARKNWEIGNLRLEFATEHVLDIFLLLVSFLRGEDLEYLNHPSKAPNAKTKSEKEARTSIGGLRPNA